MLAAPGGTPPPPTIGLHKFTWGGGGGVVCTGRIYSAAINARPVYRPVYTRPLYNSGLVEA
jgi:hypothetical protein